MSGFDQRTQPGDGSPVAGPMRRESVATTAVRSDTPGTDLASAGAGPAPRSEELHFKVRYALPEYISFMWQHAGYLIRRRRIGRLATWWM
ncbi:MAG: YcxB family protein, partial [Telluria sp.]